MQLDTQHSILNELSTSSSLVGEKEKGINWSLCCELEGFTPCQSLDFLDSLFDICEENSMLAADLSNWHK